jgi:hypothetical protein
MPLPPPRDDFADYFAADTIIFADLFDFRHDIVVLPPFSQMMSHAFAIFARQLSPFSPLTPLPLSPLPPPPDIRHFISSDADY